MAPEALTKDLDLSTTGSTSIIPKKFLNKKYFFIVMGVFLFCFYIQNISINMNFEYLSHRIPSMNIKEFVLGNKRKGVEDNFSGEANGEKNSILLNRNDATSDFDTQEEAVDIKATSRNTIEDPEILKDNEVVGSNKTEGMQNGDTKEKEEEAQMADTTPSTTHNKPTTDKSVFLKTELGQETTVSMQSMKRQEDVPVIIDSNTKNIPSNYKTILFFTAFFDGTWLKFLRNKRIDMAHHGCPITECAFTFDRSLRSTADAVVFHSSSFSPDDVPENRNPQQRYIWMNVEAPGLNQKTSKEKWHGKPGFFNWTATHQRESEILVSYGGLVPIKDTKIPHRLAPLDRNSITYKSYLESLKNRTQPGDILSWNQMNATFLTRPKLVAWMVSHCNTVSGREIYIKELQRYIKVDVYGSCGNLRCGKNHLDTFCYTDVLAPNYKFYLSFENSWCHDYITEKVFLPLQHGLVPVVYGGATYEDFLPPNSYIDATKMTPKVLAKTLLRLASSDEEYARYHLWRKYWRVEVPVPMCDLCYRLHTDQKETHIPDLGRWWFEVNNCSTRYPEDKYPRPKEVNVMPYLAKIGEGLGALSNFFQGLVHR